MILHNYKIVSFDVFDTLLCRTFPTPHDVFDAVEKRYNSENPQQVIYGFRKLRVDAEHKARSKHNREITLNDIYDELHENYTEKEIITLMGIELDVEYISSCANIKGKALFEACISDGKRVVLCSDMYLSESFIERMLRKCGIEGYEKFYLSSEIGITKASGELFDFVLRDLGISPSELIHIGDNRKSDILVPRLKGIATRHLRKTTKKSRHAPGVRYALKCITSYSAESYYYDFGFKAFGPLLYGYVSWLKRETKGDGITSILFLSRDGWLMKRAYDCVSADGEVETKYFYASRRALQTAAIWIAPDYDEVMTSMFWKRELTFARVLDQWGLDALQYENVVAEHGFSLQSKVDGKEIVDNKDIRVLYDALKKDIISNSKNEYDALLSYLRRIISGKRIGIVDIGWLGNMQHALSKVIKTAGLNCELYGYYLGIFPHSRYQNNAHMKGYLFSKEKNYRLFQKERYFATVLELMFMAPHGTVRGYVRHSYDSEAELADFEYANTETFEHISEIQRAALEFVERFKEVGELFDSSEDEMVYSKELFMHLAYPQMKDVRYLGNLEVYDDGFRRLVNQRCLTDCLLHGDLKREVLFSSWKPGLMRHLFGIPLRYTDMFECLRLLSGKN